MCVCVCVCGFYWDTFIRTTKKIRLSNLSYVITASLLYISLYFFNFSVVMYLFIYLLGELHFHLNYHCVRAWEGDFSSFMEGGGVGGGGGLTNLGIHLIFRREGKGTQEDTMILIKEWHNGTVWCACFIVPEDTNH